MKRAIQRLVENPLARKVLGGELLRGAEIVVSADERGLVFKN